MKGTKGISLPIEMIVVIAIAVLVLVVIAAFFVGSTGSLPSGIGDNTAFATGCNLLRTTYNCGDPSSVTVYNYRTPGATVDKTLYDACLRLGYSTAATCRQACGCP